MFRQFRRSMPPVELCYHEMCGIEYPVPAIQRGWLHVQTHNGPGDVARLQAAVERGLWLSGFTPDKLAASGGEGGHGSRLRALAGYWRGGGFIEASAVGNAELEDHRRFLLRVFSANAAAAVGLLGRLRDRFLLKASPQCGDPRIGLVNVSHGSLEVTPNVRLSRSSGKLVTS